MSPLFLLVSCLFLHPITSWFIVWDHGIISLLLCFCADVIQYRSIDEWMLSLMDCYQLRLVFGQKYAIRSHFEILQYFDFFRSNDTFCPNDFFSSNVFCSNWLNFVLMTSSVPMTSFPMSLLFLCFLLFQWLFLFRWLSLFHWLYSALIKFVCSNDCFSWSIESHSELLSVLHTTLCKLFTTSFRLVSALCSN